MPSAEEKPIGTRTPSIQACNLPQLVTSGYAFDVFTDMESDDAQFLILFLFMLSIEAKKQKCIVPLQIVVGGGDPAIRMQLAQTLISRLPADVQGTLSITYYAPPEKMPSRKGIYEKLLEVPEEKNTTSWPTVHNFNRYLHTVFTSETPHLVINILPIRWALGPLCEAILEMRAHFAADPTQDPYPGISPKIAEAFLSRSHFHVAYQGAFNYAPQTGDIDNKPLIEALINQCFTETVLISAYDVMQKYGAQNTINPDNTPRLDTWLKNTRAPLFQFLEWIHTKWNQASIIDLIIQKVGNIHFLPSADPHATVHNAALKKLHHLAIQDILADEMVLSATIVCLLAQAIETWIPDDLATPREQFCQTELLDRLRALDIKRHTPDTWKTELKAIIQAWWKQLPPPSSAPGEALQIWFEGLAGIQTAAAFLDHIKTLPPWEIQPAWYTAVKKARIVPADQHTTVIQQWADAVENLSGKAIIGVRTKGYKLERQLSWWLFALKYLTQAVIADGLLAFLFVQAPQLADNVGYVAGDPVWKAEKTGLFLKAAPRDPETTDDAGLPPPRLYQITQLFADTTPEGIITAYQDMVIQYFACLESMLPCSTPAPLTTPRWAAYLKQELASWDVADTADTKKHPAF